jgi:hypothetical protein
MIEFVKIFGHLMKITIQYYTSNPVKLRETMEATYLQRLALQIMFA